LFLRENQVQSINRSSRARELRVAEKIFLRLRESHYATGSVAEKEQRTAKTQEDLKRKGSHRADATGLDPCASSTVKIVVQ